MAKLPPPCPTHKIKDLSYADWHIWATEQTEKGIEQTQCPVCKRWLFPEEV